MNPQPDLQSDLFITGSEKLVYDCLKDGNKLSQLNIPIGVAGSSLAHHIMTLRKKGIQIKKERYTKPDGTKTPMVIYSLDKGTPEDIKKLRG